MLHILSTAFDKPCHRKLEIWWSLYRDRKAFLRSIEWARGREREMNYFEVENLFEKMMTIDVLMRQCKNLHPVDRRTRCRQANFCHPKSHHKTYSRIRPIAYLAVSKFQVPSSHRDTSRRSAYHFDSLRMPLFDTVDCVVALRCQVQCYLPGWISRLSKLVPILRLAQSYWPMHWQLNERG